MIVPKLYYPQIAILTVVGSSQSDEDLNISGIVTGEVSEDGNSDNEEGWGERTEKSHGLSRDIIHVAQTRNKTSLKYYNGFHNSSHL